MIREGKAKVICDGIIPIYRIGILTPYQALNIQVLACAGGALSFINTV